MLNFRMFVMSIVSGSITLVSVLSSLTQTCEWTQTPHRSSINDPWTELCLTWTHIWHHCLVELWHMITMFQFAHCSNVPVPVDTKPPHNRSVSCPGLTVWLVLRLFFWPQTVPIYPHEPTNTLLFDVFKHLIPFLEQSVFFYCWTITFKLVFVVLINHCFHCHCYLFCGITLNIQVNVNVVKFRLNHCTREVFFLIICGMKCLNKANNW